MIPKWLTDSIYANRHFKAGDAELSVYSGLLAWCFTVNKAEIPISSHRVEFKFNQDNHKDIYAFKGKFLIPSWCDFTLGSAVIMQWHGSDDSKETIALKIVDGGTALIMQVNYNDDEDAVEIIRIPLVRDVWIDFTGQYQWKIPDSGGYCDFKGTLDGNGFDYTGLMFEKMYQKYGCYRNGYLEGEYPSVQVWWTDCEKQAIRI